MCRDSRSLLIQTSTDHPLLHRERHPERGRHLRLSVIRLCWIPAVIPAREHGAGEPYSSCSNRHGQGFRIASAYKGLREECGQSSARSTSWPRTGLF